VREALPRFGAMTVVTLVALLLVSASGATAPSDDAFSADRDLPGTGAVQTNDNFAYALGIEGLTRTALPEIE
jgi:hypothetical protein